MIDETVTAGATSQIASNREVPILDIARSLPIGHFTSEYLHTRARVGLVFFHRDKAWMILHIDDKETVFVLPFENPESIIERNTSTTNPEKSSETSHKNSPATIIQPIIVESFQQYIIIHSHLGTTINTTLRLAFDALLTQQDLIRGSYNDRTRILIQTTSKLTREEIQSINTDLFHIAPREFDRVLVDAIEARFPSVVSDENEKLTSSEVKNTQQEKMRANIDAIRTKAVLRNVAKGKIKITTQFSTLRPTPRAMELIVEYERASAAELDELIKANEIRLKASIERGYAELLCLTCLSGQDSTRISDLEEKPKCDDCGSRLLALPRVSARTVRFLLQKKKASKLDPPETALLAGTRRTADLVLSYGKRAIIALSVTGVGPQAASAILASMPISDSEFYYKLLKARIHYLTTSELWDKRQGSTISSSHHVRFNI